MQFLLDKLNKQQVDPDGVEIYINPSGEQTVLVDRNLSRAIVRIGGREATLVRNGDGQWVPENNDWAHLAELLGAPGLALAPFGF